MVHSIEDSWMNEWIAVEDSSICICSISKGGGKQHLQQWKTSISPSNVTLTTNPGTVLKSACPEDSKIPIDRNRWKSDENYTFCL